MKTHLIIPDAHAHFEHDNKRFEWLGKLIYDIRPDVVVDIGDSADMPSLCHYDKSHHKFNSRSYRKDCDVYIDAMEKTWHPYKKHKKKLPLRVKTKGNHEFRIEKSLEQETTWRGLYSPADLEEERFNDHVYPHLKEALIDGITYNHYAPTPLMSKPIGGVSPAYKIIKEKHKSYVVGHDHRRFFHEEAGLMSLVVGCYVDYHADFAGVANNNWWRGVVVLRGVENGRFDHEWIGMRRIKEEYDV